MAVYTTIAIQFNPAKWLMAACTTRKGGAYTAAEAAFNLTCRDVKPKIHGRTGNVRQRRASAGCGVFRIIVFEKKDL